MFADCSELTLIETDIVRNGKKVYNLDNWKYGFTEVTYVEDTRRVSSADDIKHIKKITSHGQEIYYIEV